MHKKLVILHPAHWEQAMGGAELQISYLVKYLILQKGYEIHYIFEDIKTPISNKYDVILHPLKKVKKINKFGNEWFRYIIKIKKIIKDIKPDIIYTRYYSSWAFAAAEYTKKHSCTYVYAIASDNDLTKHFTLSLLISPFSIIEMVLTNRAIKKTTRIITQNSFQQTILKNRFSLNGYLVNQMTPLVNEEKIVKKSNPVQILWIGNLKTIKRPELFIELARRLVNLDVDYRMIMAGELPQKYKPMINSAINNIPNFEYKGKLSQDQVNDLLIQSHILVNTSEYEGFSNTFVQAWMRKVPVVSMSSNPNEIITKFDTGFLAFPIEYLTDSVKTLIKNSALRERKGENAYNYAVKYNTLEYNIEKVISILSF